MIDSCEMDQLSYRSLPVILLASTWAAFDVVLKAFESLSKMKESILIALRQVSPPSDLQVGIAYDILNWDYIPLSFGITGFCLVFTLLIWKVPNFYVRDLEISEITPKQQASLNSVHKSMRKLCVLVSLFGGFGTVAFGIGCIADRSFLKDQISAYEATVKVKTVETK